MPKNPLADFWDRTKFLNGSQNTQQKRTKKQHGKKSAGGGSGTAVFKQDVHFNMPTNQLLDFDGRAKFSNGSQQQRKNNALQCATIFSHCCVATNRANLA